MENPSSPVLKSVPPRRCESPENTLHEQIVQMLTSFYAVMGNAPEVVGSLNAMAGALLEEGATVTQVREALRRCRREKFPVRLPHILENLPGHGADDGRPGPELAWSMCPRSDEQSVVWTEEMATAYDGARKLLLSRDEIGARMAFKEAYEKEVSKARDNRIPVHWVVSLGWDKGDRIRALSEAVEKRRISGKNALELAGDQYEELRMALPAGQGAAPQLTGGGNGEVKLDLPGMSGMLKVLADSKAMELPESMKPKAIPRERALEEQLHDLHQREQAGLITSERAAVLADALKNVAARRSA